jgi:hypothetical protein
VAAVPADWQNNQVSMIPLKMSASQRVQPDCLRVSKNTLYLLGHCAALQQLEGQR